MPCEKNTVTKRTEVQQNTYMSREHKAYTYLRIYTLKYKNACIVNYVAVFFGYQVKKKQKKLYKTFVEILSHMPITVCTKVTLDMTGFASWIIQKNKTVYLT